MKNIIALLCFVGLAACGQGLNVSWSRFVPMGASLTYPTNIPGLLWWFNGDDASLKNAGHINETNTGVPSFWTNLASSAGEAQATGSPVYYYTNPLGQVRFSTGNSVSEDGNPYYFTTSGSARSTNAQPLTLFTLVWFDKTNQNGGNTQVWIDSVPQSPDDANNNCQMGCVDSRFFISAGTTLFSASNLVQTNKWYYQSCVFNGANSLLRVNGAAIISGNAGSHSFDGINLGYPQGANGFTLIGRLAEVIVYGAALTTNQMVQIESYLTNKYSLSP